MKRRILAAFLGLTALAQLFITGCSSDVTSENVEKANNDSTEYDYQIYCVDEDGSGLVSWGYDISNTDLSADEVVNEIFEQFSSEPDMEGLSSAKPSKIKKISCVLEEDVVKVNCDKYYDKLDSLSQLYFKAALVLTMTQIEEVKYVYITVKGQPLKDSSGNPVGYLGRNNFVTNDDFIGNTGIDIYTTIYYPNEAGDGLVAENVYYLYDEQQCPAMYVLDMLKKSAGKSGNAVISENVIVENAFVKDGICYVDFNENINKTSFDGVEPEVILYAIVNSLSELMDVTGVQITVNGRADVMFKNEISLNQIFRMNLDIVD